MSNELKPIVKIVQQNYFRLWLVSLFFFLLSTRLMLIQFLDFTFPWLDPWLDEMCSLYPRYETGMLTGKDLLTPWNEHRILPTRALALTLYVLNNGQWDNQLQTFISGLLHTLMLVGFAWAAKCRFGLLGFWFSALFLLAVFGLPVIWFNAVWGFQSPFYFLVGCALGAVYWLCRETLCLRDVVIGVILALTSLATMGSGFLAAGAIAVTLGGAILATRSKRMELLGGFLIIVLVAAGGAWLLLSGPRFTPGQRNLLDIITSTLRCLAWPNANSFRLYVLAPLALMAWLPWLALLAQTLIRRQAATRHLWIISLGWWAGLHALAISVGRPHAGHNPLNRYLDILAWGVVANGFCLLALWKTQDISRHRLAAFSAIWVAVTSVGFVQTASHELQALASFKYEEVASYKRFVLSVVNGLPPTERPPDWRDDDTATLTQDAALRRRLPVSIRPPLPSDVPPQMTTLPNDYPAAPRYGLAVSSFQREETGLSDVRSPLYAPPRMPYVEVFLAGDAGKKRGPVTVTIQDEQGRALQTLTPRGERQAWMRCLFPSPNVPFHIVLTHATPDSWGACTAPREVGRLTAWLVVPLDLWITLCLTLAALATGVALWLTLADKYLAKPVAGIQTTSPPAES